MKEPRITLRRAVTLHTDDEFIGWLKHNKIDTMNAWCLTALDATLTVWRVDCYSTEGDGRTLKVRDGDFVTHQELIETTAADRDWLGDE